MGAFSTDPHRFKKIGTDVHLVGRQIFTMDLLTNIHNKIEEKGSRSTYNKETMQTKGFFSRRIKHIYIRVPQILVPDSSGSTEFHRKSSELHAITTSQLTQHPWNPILTQKHKSF